MEIEALAARYPLVESTLTLAGRDWLITSVTDQGYLVDQVKTEEDLRWFPYGLMLWASAMGLAEWLVDMRQDIGGTNVLEIGAGIGVAGLVAAHLGANVTQTDFLPDALTLCRYNAVTNGIHTVDVRIGDWREWPDTIRPMPVVIGSDILYDRDVHPLLQALLPRLVTPGGTMLLTDPLRPQALDFMEQLERTTKWTVDMQGRTVSFEGQPKEIAFFRLTHCA